MNYSFHYRVLFGILLFSALIDIEVTEKAKQRVHSRSEQHIKDLMNCISSDKEQLLEIAKANAAAMCAKAGMPIPASLRTSVLPFPLPSMAMNAAVASMTAGMF